MSRLDGLPEREKRAIDAVRVIARASALAPCLVGGPVRDLELGRPVVDLDVALEEGAGQLATELARRLHGEVREFPQFLTFKIEFPDGFTLDIATTRREVYPHPGALPVVTKASLKDDLERRDFTINAIALDLIKEEIIDPFGGLADLGAGVIRILHEKSFLDDPTRLFRALRLATRLGFALDARTHALFGDAVEGGALGAVSRDRKMRELFLAFEETDAADVLVAFADARLLHDLLGVDSIDRRRLQRVQDIKAGDHAVLFLSALRPRTVEGLGLSARRLSILRELLERESAFAREVLAAPTDEVRFALIDAASPELRALAAATDARVSRAIDSWTHYRSLDLGVRGDELGVPPGPHIAKALAKTRLALSRHEIAPGEARAFASQAALEYLDSSKTRLE